MFDQCLIRLRLKNWLYFMIHQLSEYESPAKYLNDTMASNSGSKL